MAIAFVQKASFELTKMQMQFSSDSFGEKKKTSAKIRNCSPSSGVGGQILSFLLVLQNGVLPSNYESGVWDRGNEPVHADFCCLGLGVYSPGRVSSQIPSDSELRRRWSEFLEVIQKKVVMFENHLKVEI